MDGRVNARWAREAAPSAADFCFANSVSQIRFDRIGWRRRRGL
jgi:hypothetical protein